MKVLFHNISLYDDIPVQGPDVIEIDTSHKTLTPNLVGMVLLEQFRDEWTDDTDPMEVIEEVQDQLLISKNGLVAKVHLEESLYLITILN